MNLNMMICGGKYECLWSLNIVGLFAHTRRNYLRAFKAKVAR